MLRAEIDGVPHFYGRDFERRLRRVRGPLRIAGLESPSNLEFVHVRVCNRRERRLARTPRPTQPSANRASAATAGGSKASTSIFPAGEKNRDATPAAIGQDR